MICFAAGLRLRIKPGCIMVALAADFHIVVARSTFPGTYRVARTWLEMLPSNGIGRKILVSFDFHTLVRFREHCAFPDCFCHRTCLDCRTGRRSQSLNSSVKAPSQSISGQSFNGHSMVGRLRRVLVCSPRAAGWDIPAHADRWQELGFLHAPEFATAQTQHDQLCRQLESAGAEVIHLPAGSDLSLDAVYT